MSFRESMRSFLSMGDAGRSGVPGHVPFRGIGTVFISNLCGLGGSLEGCGAEVFASHVNRVVDIQVRAVHETAGVFLGFGADISIAYWHPTNTKPSHGELALACGLRILKEFRRLQSNEPFSMNIRIALGTGDMSGDLIAGRIQVVGPAWNTARQLMDLGRPQGSSMLCTQETLDIAPSLAVPLRSAGRIQHGSGKEVDVYEVLTENV